MYSVHLQRKLCRRRMYPPQGHHHSSPPKPPCRHVNRVVLTQSCPVFHSLTEPFKMEANGQYPGRTLTPALRVVASPTVSSSPSPASSSPQSVPSFSSSLP